jgi:hypothetical protein
MSRVTIVRGHFVDRLPVADICDEYGFSQPFLRLAVAAAGEHEHALADRRTAARNPAPSAAQDGTIDKLLAKLQKKDLIRPASWRRHASGGVNWLHRPRALPCWIIHEASQILQHLRSFKCGNGECDGDADMADLPIRDCSRTSASFPNRACKPHRVAHCHHIVAPAVQ